jgi:hypothetical protein
VLKSTHPELGHYTYVEENSPLIVWWVDATLRRILGTCSVDGKKFCKHTRNHFTGIRQINVKLLQKLSQKCTVDDVIIKTFVSQRIFIKIFFFKRREATTKN